MFDWLSSPQAWIGLLTLTVLEIVLGIDNIIFISLLSNRLPAEQRSFGRKMGLAVALISRILLLLAIGWIAQLTTPILHLPLSFLSEEGQNFSWRDLILLTGGLFLIYKAVREIHEKLEGSEEAAHGNGAKVTLASVLVQIMIIDVVFSLDSVITAVGMVKEVSVMIVAVIIAVGFMMFAVNAIAAFVDDHPTIKILALAFLVLIGVNLVAEATGQHIEKGYTYFAMAFAVGVEMLNLKMRKKTDRSVELHEPHLPPDP